MDVITHKDVIVEIDFLSAIVTFVFVVLLVAANNVSFKHWRRVEGRIATRICTFELGFARVGQYVIFQKKVAL
jgi:hypothetical protein